MSIIDRLKMPAAFLAGGVVVVGGAYLAYQACRPEKSGQEDKAPKIDTNKAANEVKNQIDLSLAGRVASFRIFTDYDPDYDKYNPDVLVEPQHNSLFPAVKVMLRLVQKDDAQAKQCLGRMLDWCDAYKDDQRLDTAGLAADYLLAYQCIEDDFEVGASRLVYQDLTYEGKIPNSLEGVVNLVASAERVFEVRQKIADLRAHGQPQLYGDILDQIEQEQCQSWVPTDLSAWYDRLTQSNCLFAPDQLRSRLFGVVDEAHENLGTSVEAFEVKRAFCCRFFRIVSDRRYPVDYYGHCMFAVAQYNAGNDQWRLEHRRIHNGLPEVRDMTPYHWVPERVHEKPLTEVVNQCRDVMKRFLLDRLDEELPTSTMVPMYTSEDDFRWCSYLTDDERNLVRSLLDHPNWDDAAVVHLVRHLGTQQRAIRGGEGWTKAIRLSLACVLGERGVSVDEMKPIIDRLVGQVEWPATVENLRELVANEHN